MPATDGCAFRAEADRQDTLQGIPIIVASGAANVAQEAQKLKAAAALAKPFELDELVQAIQDVVKDEHPERERSQK